MRFALTARAPGAQPSRLLAGATLAFVLALHLPAALSAQTPRTIDIGAVREISARLVLTIEDDDGSAAREFVAPRGAVWLSTGAILVLDAGTRDVRELRSATDTGRVLLPRGRGPGEVELPAWISADGAGGAAVYDRSLRRVLSRIGEGDTRAESLSDFGSFEGPADVVGRFGDGRLLVVTAEAATAGAGALRAPQSYLVASRGQTPVELARVAGDEIFVRISPRGGRILGTPPFQAKALAGVAGDRAALLDGAAGLLHVFNADGESLGSPLRLVARDRALDGRRIRRRLDALFGTRSSATRDAWERLQREMIATDSMPIADALYLDEAGQAWIRLFSLDAVEGKDWLLLDLAQRDPRLVRLPPDCGLIGVRASGFVARCELADGRVSIRGYELVPDSQ